MTDRPDAANPVSPADAAAGVPVDPWHDLRRHTAARIAIGRVGTGLPTREVLALALAHAQARDAVHVPLDVDALRTALGAAGADSEVVRSAAPDRATYLLRPDLGRRLADGEAARLAARADREAPAGGWDLVLVIGDGLSSLGVGAHAPALVDAIRAAAPAGWRLAPLVIARQARVALGDEIGEQWRARLCAIIIGERPGLSSPDSLGIYLTHGPRVGRRDHERNCLSNVRPAGLPIDAAARRFWWLASEARARALTGVALKDDSGPPPARVAGA